MAVTRNPTPAIFFAEPAKQYDPSFEGKRNNAIIEHFQRCVPNDRASGFLLLSSPNGTVFKITVSDSGVLTATVAGR